MFEKLRQPVKRLIEPVARALVKAHISANMVTVIGAVGCVVASLWTGITGHLFAGCMILTALVFFDSLDGSVAALTGGGTAFGAFLDSTLDRIADWALIVGSLVYFVYHTDMHSMWSQVAVASAVVSLMTGFVTPYVRARAQAIGLEAKNGIATRSDRLVIILVGMGFTGLGMPVYVFSIAFVILAFTGLITVWQRIHTVYVQVREQGLA